MHNGQIHFKNIAMFAVSMSEYFCKFLKKVSQLISSEAKQVLRREQIIMKTPVHFPHKFV